jgi:hypothetical protein
MHFRYFLISIIYMILNCLDSYSQKTYSSNVWEFIFSYSDVTFSQDFLSEFPAAEVTNSSIRFTAFFHFEHDWHLDFTNNAGLITGFGIRNIGISTNEVLPYTIEPADFREYKIIRRVYTLGIPLALKLGSFKDHLFFYAGGECELAIHFKEKYWSGAQHRTGKKSKYSEWFGEQTPHLLPSLFGGVKLPGGINLRARYYLSNFLNSSYNNQDSLSIYNVSDLSRYDQTQVYYLSVSWQFNSNNFKNKHLKNEEVTLNTL